MINRIVLTLIAAQLTFAAVNYSYDAAGRLTKIDYGTAGSISYTYDKAGNLLSRNVVPSAVTGGTITIVNTIGSDAPAGIAQNTWVEIRGNNLFPAATAAAGVIWSAAPDFLQGKMPTQLNGVTVTVNSKPAYVEFFCSAATDQDCPLDQVNILTPLDNTTGDVQVVVTSGASSASAIATMHTSVPSFFLWAGNHVVATHTNNALLGPTTLYPGLSTPASRNEQIVLYATGFGLPTGTLTPGASSQAGSLPVLPVCQIGTDNAPVLFAGLIGPGEFQINLTVPNTAATTGDRPVTCTYNGASTSSTGLIAVNP